MSTLAVLVVGVPVVGLERDARSAMERDERVMAGGWVVGEIRYAGSESVHGAVAHKFTAEFPDD